MVARWVTCLLVAAFIVGAACQGSCGPSSVVVRTEHTVAGCSAADAGAIVTATALIVADVTRGISGGDRSKAAIDVVAQLAVIHAAWARCSANARAGSGSGVPPPEAPPPVVAPASPAPGFLPAGAPR